MEFRDNALMAGMRSGKIRLSWVIHQHEMLDLAGIPKDHPLREQIRDLDWWLQDSLETEDE